MALTPRGRIKEAERRQEIRRLLPKIDQPLTPQGVAPSEVDQVANILERERAKGVPINQSTFQNGLGEEIITPVQKFSMMPNIRLGLDLSRFLVPEANPTGNAITSFDAVLTTASGAVTIITLPAFDGFSLIYGGAMSMRSQSGLADFGYMQLRQMSPGGGTATLLVPAQFLTAAGAAMQMNVLIPRLVIPPNVAVTCLAESLRGAGSIHVMFGMNVYRMRKGTFPDL